MNNQPEPNLANPAKTKRSRSEVIFQAVAALVILLLLSAILVPNFIKARPTHGPIPCIHYLRQIDSAKEQWLLSNVIMPDHVFDPALALIR